MPLTAIASPVPTFLPAEYTAVVFTATLSLPSRFCKAEVTEAVLVPSYTLFTPV